MKQLKYIIFEDNSFILFDGCQKHSEVCNRVDIKYAGFCSIDSVDNDINVICYGESISLKKMSSKIDSSIIKYWLTGEF
jgi:hypothetical protein